MNHGRRRHFLAWLMKVLEVQCSGKIIDVGGLMWCRYSALHDGPCQTGLGEDFHLDPAYSKIRTEVEAHNLRMEEQRQKEETERLERERIFGAKIEARKIGIPSSRQLFVRGHAVDFPGTTKEIISERNDIEDSDRNAYSGDGRS